MANEDVRVIKSKENGTGLADFREADDDDRLLAGGVKLKGASTANRVALLADDDTTNFELKLPPDAGSGGQVLKSNGDGTTEWGSAAGTGDVVGPASSVDGRVAVFDGATGKLLKTGTKAESDVVVGPASSADDEIPLFSGAGGKTLKNSSRSVAFLVPTGAVLPFAGSAAPSGWLLCHGQAISRTANADLFAAIGVTYGVGDGSTTFNLPDLRGRSVFGKDDMGGVAANRLTTPESGINGTVLGASGGAQSVTLTTAQLAPHTHAMNTGPFSSGTESVNHTHGFSTGGVSVGHQHPGPGDVFATAGHTHSVSGGARINITFPPAPITRLIGMARTPGPTWGGTTSVGFTPAQASAPGAAPGSDNQYAELFANTNAPSSNSSASSLTGGITSDHTHSGTTGVQSPGHTHATTLSGNTGAAGSGSTHQNTPPALVMNYIIKS